MTEHNMTDDLDEHLEADLSANAKAWRAAMVRHPAGSDSLLARSFMAQADEDCCQCAERCHHGDCPEATDA